MCNLYGLWWCKCLQHSWSVVFVILSDNILCVVTTGWDIWPHVPEEQANSKWDLGQVFQWLRLRATAEQKRCARQKRRNAIDKHKELYSLMLAPCDFLCTVSWLQMQQLSQLSWCDAHILCEKIINLALTGRKSNECPRNIYNSTISMERKQVQCRRVTKKWGIHTVLLCWCFQDKKPTRVNKNVVWTKTCSIMFHRCINTIIEPSNLELAPVTTSTNIKWKTECGISASTYNTAWVLLSTGWKMRNTALPMLKRCKVPHIVLSWCAQLFPRKHCFVQFHHLVLLLNELTATHWGGSVAALSCCWAQGCGFDS